MTPPDVVAPSCEAAELVSLWLEAGPRQRQAALWLLRQPDDNPLAERVVASVEAWSE
jgi:hypothetical protein